MDKDQINSLAQKIALAIASESKPVGLGDIQKSLDAINKRLDKIEALPVSNLRSQPLAPNHPSQDHFAIAEAIVDSLFDRNTKEKACAFEPNGKPCDHCSMCNSRGF
ncbi:MAG: hypothetical protein ABIO36_10040 [Pyrinomonadaceae bacterium]